MNLLAIDTAGKTAAVAVLRDEVLLYEAAANNGLTHSETLLPMVDTALKACGLRCADIDLYGVTAGPGSFTGLRIGLAAVKGMALPRQTPCAGVSTLEALAWGMAGQGTVVGALDARRGQVYWAGFDLATHDRLTPDAAAPVQALENFVAGCKSRCFLLATAPHCATIDSANCRACCPAPSRCVCCGAAAWRWRPAGCCRPAARCPPPSCCPTTTA